MDGFRFSTDLTVRFNEMDAQGVVHHSVYLIWFEIARIAYLAQFRGGYRSLVQEGVDATTVEAHVAYRAASRFEDRLRLHARATDVHGKRGGAAARNPGGPARDAAATRLDRHGAHGRGHLGG